MNKITLTTSSKLTIAVLVAMAAAELMGVLLLMGEHPPVALVIELVLLVMAGLVFTRRWWATAVAAALTGLLTIASLDGVRTAASKPLSLEFTFAFVFMALAIVATWTGIRATLENYRKGR